MGQAPSHTEEFKELQQQSHTDYESAKKTCPMITPGTILNGDCWGLILDFYIPESPRDRCHTALHTFLLILVRFGQQLPHRPFFHCSPNEHLRAILRKRHGAYPYALARYGGDDGIPDDWRKLRVSAYLGEPNTLERSLLRVEYPPGAYNCLFEGAADGDQEAVMEMFAHELQNDKRALRYLVTTKCAAGFKHFAPHQLIESRDYLIHVGISHDWVPAIKAASSIVDDCELAYYHIFAGAVEKGSVNVMRWVGETFKSPKDLISGAMAETMRDQPKESVELLEAARHWAKKELNLEDSDLDPVGKFVHAIQMSHVEFAIYFRTWGVLVTPEHLEEAFTESTIELAEMVHYWAIEDEIEINREKLWHVALVRGTEFLKAAESWGYTMTPIE